MAAGSSSHAARAEPWRWVGEGPADPDARGCWAPAPDNAQEPKEALWEAQDVGAGAEEVLPKGGGGIGEDELEKQRWQAMGWRTSWEQREGEPTWAEPEDWWKSAGGHWWKKQKDGGWLQQDPPTWHQGDGARWRCVKCKNCNTDLWYVERYKERVTTKARSTAWGKWDVHAEQAYQTEDVESPWPPQEETMPADSSPKRLKRILD